MKPKIIYDWIVTLAAFRPDDISNEEWDILNPGERAERASFTAYRIRPVIIYAYNEASIAGCSTLWFGNQDSITVTGTIEEYDKLFIQQ